VGEGEELFQDSGWLSRLEEAGLSSRAGTYAAQLLSGTEIQLTLVLTEKQNLYDVHLLCIVHLLPKPFNYF